MATYQVETDNGTYQVETEEPGLTVGGAKQPIPSDVANEQGLIDQGIGGLNDSDLNKAGEDIATSKFGQKNPTMGAALGTAVAKAPDVAMAAQGLSDVPAMAEGLSAVTKSAAGFLKDGAENLVNKMGKPFASTVEALKGPSSAEAQAMGKEMRLGFNPEENIEKAKLVGQQIVSPQEAKVTYMEQQLKGLPEENAGKLQKLQDMRKDAGSLMNEAEQEGGFAVTPDSNFEATAASPEKMGNVLNVMGKWADMDPKEIANTVDPETINLFRKLSKAGQDKLSDVGRLTMQKGESAASDALATLSDKFASAKSQYKDIMRSIADIEDTQPLKAKALQRQIAYLKVGLEQSQQEASNLLQATRTGNAVQRRDIDAKALDLLKQGIAHDRALNKIKIAVGAVGAGTAYKFLGAH